MSETATIIDVVEAVKAVQRIQPEHRHQPGEKTTFYSKHDIWLYDARMDSKVCPKCRYYEEIGQFLGNHIRLIFPNHKIQDVNTIGGPEPDGGGLVHPNCRCLLVRKIGGELYA